MKPLPYRLGAFALALLLLAGCNDKHDPVKPTVVGWTGITAHA